jgi:hypothetical protein
MAARGRARWAPTSEGLPGMPRPIRTGRTPEAVQHFIGRMQGASPGFLPTGCALDMPWRMQGCYETSGDEDAG